MIVTVVREAEAVPKGPGWWGRNRAAGFEIARAALYYGNMLYRVEVNTYRLGLEAGASSWRTRSSSPLPVMGHVCIHVSRGSISLMLQVLFSLFRGL